MPYFYFMEFTYLKAVHLIFIVSWFAALFYIVRLFIYATEANEKPENEKLILVPQLVGMQKRLWYMIGWPAMAGTLITGIWLIALNATYYFSLPWIWLKLFCVLLLILYHLQCQGILNQQKKGLFRYASMRLRLFNELATVFLVAIIFLAVVKSTSGLLWGIVGLIIFAGVLMLAVVMYRKSSGRKK